MEIFNKISKEQFNSICSVIGIEATVDHLDNSYMRMVKDISMVRVIVDGLNKIIAGIDQCCTSKIDILIG